MEKTSESQSAWHYVNLPAQVRAHPRATAGAGTVMAVGAGLWFLISRRIAERRRLENRFVRRSIAQRVLTAVAITVATGLVRRLMEARRHDHMEADAPIR